MTDSIITAAKLEGAATELVRLHNRLFSDTPQKQRDAVAFAITILEREAAAARIREGLAGVKS